MRQLVLEFMATKDRAMSLSELQQEMEQADLTTLYRTLKTFESKGIIHNIDDGTGAMKYAVCEDTCEPIRHRELHLHFHCTSCNGNDMSANNRNNRTKSSGRFTVSEVNLTAKEFVQITYPQKPISSF